MLHPVPLDISSAGSRYCSWGGGGWCLTPAAAQDGQLWLGQRYAAGHCAAGQDRCAGHCKHDGCPDHGGFYRSQPHRRLCPYAPAEHRPRHDHPDGPEPGRRQALAGAVGLCMRDAHRVCLIPIGLSLVCFWVRRALWGCLYRTPPYKCWARGFAADRTVILLPAATNGIQGYFRGMGDLEGDAAEQHPEYGGPCPSPPPHCWCCVFIWRSRLCPGAMR